MAVFSFSVVAYIFISFMADASAAVYYVAPRGSDFAAGTRRAPWGTFAHAMNFLRPGDTLYLLDGTYTLRNNPGQPAILYVTKSGRAGRPVKIRALHEGKVIVDGQKRVLCYQSRRNYIEVDGINFRSSGGSGSNWGHGMDLAGNHVTIRRCTIKGFGYNNLSAASGENNSAGINVAGGSNILLEDNAIFINAGTNQHNGSPRMGINLYESNYSIVRRNFIYWQPGGDPASPKGIQVYGASDCIVENNIIADETNGGDGIFIWYNNYNSHSSNNGAYGNIVMDSSGWAIWTATQPNHNPPPFQVHGSNISGNVLIGCPYGLRNGGDNAQVMKNNTIVNIRGGIPGISICSFKQSGYRAGYTLNTEASNNSLLHCRGAGISAWGSYIGTTNEDYNNFSTSGHSEKRGPHDKSISPNYDTHTYGNGAYLMVPITLRGLGQGGTGIGATVLYEYQKGALTTRHLWPWPMEHRILDEFGLSPTWQQNGGLWKTLKGVYHKRTK
ncbi:MAG: hypothetical protein M0018_04195 [Nitrospiraceae bacterium]|nr:hypothetical protein [Nitrospiraceae bacterium]